MKTLKNTFGTKRNKKSLNNFSESLNINAMGLIRGGDGTPQDDDLWPPIDDEETAN